MGREVSTMNLGGRPVFSPSKDNYQLVEALVIAGVQHKLISNILKISEPTLRKHFKKQLQTAKSRANALVAQSLFQKARDGNVVAQIFWLKTQAGWKESNALELTGANGKELFSQEKQLSKIKEIFESINLGQQKYNPKPLELVEAGENKTNNSTG